MPLRRPPSHRRNNTSSNENLYRAWRSNRGAERASGLAEAGHTTAGGGNGVAGEERSNNAEDSSTCTSYLGNSGVESNTEGNTEGGEGWCGGSGTGGGRTSNSSLSRPSAGGQQRCNVAYIYGDTDGGEERSPIDSSEQEEAGGGGEGGGGGGGRGGGGGDDIIEDSELDSSSDDGMGDSCSVADITEGLDGIGDVSRQPPRHTTNVDGRSVYIIIVWLPFRQKQEHKTTTT